MRNTAAPTSRRAALYWLEPSGLTILAGLIIWFLAVSWRRWPDPLIDFGRELYVPWRLVNGALLYRDVDEFYGPLSKYFNAILFIIFKPGLMVLVAANLAVFGAIIAVLYLILRRAWGFGAALLASAVFVAVFGFSQFVSSGNYNYATPYSHEATHGLLVCLLLVFVLVKWVDEPTRWRSFLAGLLLGLTALLKPEILFAAVVVTFVAIFERWRLWRWAGARGNMIWIIGALLPTAAFTLYFLRFVPFQEALAYACKGWLNILSARFTNNAVERGFLGFDQPWLHLSQHALATLAACALIGAIVLIARFSDKIQRRSILISIGACLAAGTAGFGSAFITWGEVGRCLFGLIFLYLVWGALLTPRDQTQIDDNSVRIARRLIVFLALAMMARMILNGRIYQYGFYQAALAAVVISAFLIGEIPARLGIHRGGQIIMAIGVVALVVSGVVSLSRQSAQLLQMKTVAISQGIDRFYAFPSQVESSGETVATVTKLITDNQSGQSLLVLPEGVMINYLTRRPSTVAEVFFFSAATEGGREAEIVRQLDRSPPDLVVFIRRDLSEYGIQRYGDRPGNGALILAWLSDNYRVDFQNNRAAMLRRK